MLSTFNGEENNVANPEHPTSVLQMRNACKNVMYTVVSSWAYDGKHKEFILVPGEVSLVYLNGQLLSEPQLLADGDQMCVGEEQLCFQSFCGEYR